MAYAICVQDTFCFYFADLEAKAIVSKQCAVYDSDW